MNDVRSITQGDELSRQKKESRERITLVLFSCIYTFCFVGAFFGYGPMQLLLEDAGAYSSKCGEDAETVCPAQTAALLRVHFTAQITLVLSPVLGTIADHYGAPMLVLLMAVCNWVGLLLLIVAVALDLDVGILPVAFVGLGISSFSGGLLTVQTGMIYSGGKAQARVIFLLNALFDAGGIAYLALWGIKEWFENISLTAILSAYFGLSVLTFGPSVYLWFRVTPEERPEPANNSLTGSNPQTTEEGSSDAPKDVSDEGDFSSENDVAAGLAPSRYIPVAQRSQIDQLKSTPFLLVAFVSTILVTMNMWTITTTRDFLAHLGDDETGNKYLSIFTLMMPVSLVGVPFVDVIIHRLGFEAGFQGICFLALGNNLIRLLSDNLNVQIIGFIFFSFFRCFLYGVSLSFLPTFLSDKVVGKATGIIYALTGGTAFLNIPLVNFAVESQGGDFRIPTLLYTFLLVPCFVANFWIGRCIKQEARAR